MRRCGRPYSRREATRPLSRGRKIFSKCAPTRPAIALASSTRPAAVEPAQQQTLKVGVLQRVGVRELANGLGQVALFLHDQAEPYHLHGLVGRKAERLFETLLRLRQFPELVIDKPSWL